MAGMPMSQMAIRSQISSAVHMIVQLSRMRDGSRRVTSIAEITGMEGDIIQLQEIHKLRRLGVAEDGKISTEFRATGVRPSFIGDLETMNIHLDPHMFNPSTAL
ncbi:hypothetical protein [Sulfitobacter aestuariivivens]